MTQDLDSLDRKIIALLQRDGRLPASEIARTLGASQRTVRFRIDRLIRTGVMGIAAWVETAKFDLPLSATVVVDAAPHRARRLAERFVDLDEVIYVAMAEPLGSIVLSIVGKSGPQIRRYVDTVIRPLDGVREARIFVETTLLKDEASWYPPGGEVPGG